MLNGEWAEPYRDVRERLAVIAEELADLGRDRLRAALVDEEEGATSAQAEERRLASARRAVLRAVAALGGDDGPDL